MPTRLWLWRRLDQPGHECCRCSGDDAGWRLQGTAVFVEGGLACQLDYEVQADPAWHSRSARLRGWVGRDEIDLSLLLLADGSWSLNGVPQPGTAGCLDADLGFTPATNLLVVRRALDGAAPGAGIDAPAAYLQFPELRLIRLPQHYRRLSATEIHYESPEHGYAGTLVVDDFGAIVRYPQLWELVAAA